MKNKVALITGFGVFTAIVIGVTGMAFWGCGGGCDSSTFEPACINNDTAISACLFGLDATQDCEDNFRTGAVCCEDEDGDPMCRMPSGADCSSSWDCCSDTCGGDGKCT